MSEAKNQANTDASVDRIVMRQFCVVFPGTRMVDVSPGISAKERPDYRSEPCMKTEFFHSEEGLKEWLLKHGQKSDLSVYRMQPMKFGISTSVDLDA